MRINYKVTSDINEKKVKAYKKGEGGSEGKGG